MVAAVLRASFWCAYCAGKRHMRLHSALRLGAFSATRMFAQLLQASFYCLSKTESVPRIWWCMVQKNNLRLYGFVVWYHNLFATVYMSCCLRNLDLLALVQGSMA